MTRRLYLMRHAETLFNLQGKTQGWCDSPLTPRGIEQARLTGLEFARRGLTFDHAYSSTSERCNDTLELATEAAFGEPMPYERRKGLKEINFGAFEGKDQFLELHDANFGEFYVPFGGERHRALRGGPGRDHGAPGASKRARLRPWGHCHQLLPEVEGACPCPRHALLQLPDLRLRL